MALKDPNAWINKKPAPKAKPKGPVRYRETKHGPRKTRSPAPARSLRDVLQTGYKTFNAPIVPKKPKTPKYKLKTIPHGDRLTLDQAQKIAGTQLKALHLDPTQAFTPDARARIAVARKSKDPYQRRAASQLHRAMVISRRNYIQHAKQLQGQQKAKKDTGSRIKYNAREITQRKGLAGTGSPFILAYSPVRAGELGYHVTKATLKDPGKAAKANIKFTKQLASGLVTAPLMVVSGKVTPRQFLDTTVKDYSAKYGEAFKSHPDWKKFEQDVEKHPALDYALDAATLAALGGKAVGALAKTGALGHRLKHVVEAKRPDLRVGQGEHGAKRQRDETDKAMPNIFRVGMERAIDMSRHRALNKRFEEASARDHNIPTVFPKTPPRMAQIPRTTLNRTPREPRTRLEPTEVVPGGIDRLVPMRMKRLRARDAVTLKSSLRVWVQEAQRAVLPGVAKEIRKLSKQEQLGLRYLVGGLVTPGELAKGHVADLIEHKYRGREEHGLEPPKPDGEKHEFGTLLDMHNNPDRYFTPEAERVAGIMRRSEANTAKRDPALTGEQAELRRIGPQANLMKMSRRKSERISDYIKRVKAAARERGLRDDAAYFPSERFDTPRRAEFAGGGASMSHAPKKWEGKLFDTGREQLDPRIFIEGQARSIKRGVQWPAIQQFLDSVADKSLSGKAGLPIFKLKEAIEKRGHNIEDYDFYLPSLGQHTVENLKDLDDAPQVEMPSVQKALMESVREGGDVARMATDPKYKQVRAFAVPKGTIDELLPTTNKPAGAVTAGRLWNIGKSKTSRGMFAYNFPWLTANVGSNTLTSLISGITPIHAIKGEKWWKELSPEARQYLSAVVDVTSRMDNLYEPQLGAASSGLTAPFQRAWAAYRKTKLGGRAPLKSSIDAWMQIERRTANQPFRLAAFYKAMEKDKNFIDLNKHAGEANALMDKLIEIVKLPPGKQVEALRANQKHIEHYANLTDEALGDFLRFSKSERVMNGGLMFYPWIRFSLRWAFKTLPGRHPILLNIASKLIQMNNEELTNILGTEPPADMLGNVKMPDWMPVVGGRIIDTRKYTPTGNSLMELVQDEDTASALGLLPPAGSALFTATSRRDARNRLNFVNVGGKRSDPYTGPENYDIGDAARVFASQMVGANFPLREIGRYREKGRSGSDSLPFSERPIRVKSGNAVRADKQRRAAQAKRSTPRIMLAHYLGLDIQDVNVLRNSVEARKRPEKKKKKGGGGGDGGQTFELQGGGGQAQDDLYNLQQGGGQ